MITDEAKRVKAQAYAEYVQGVVKRKHTIERLIRHQREELDVAAVTMGEHVSSSPRADAIPNGVGNLMELVENYSADLNEYVDAVDRFIRAIRRLWPQYEQVLELRYIECRQWDEIAEIAAYGDRYIYDIHRLALVGLYDVMPARWR